MTWTTHNLQPITKAYLIDLNGSDRQKILFLCLVHLQMTKDIVYRPFLEMCFWLVYFETSGSNKVAMLAVYHPGLDFTIINHYREMQVTGGQESMEKLQTDLSFSSSCLYCLHWVSKLLHLRIQTCVFIQSISTKTAFNSIYEPKL